MIPSLCFGRKDGTDSSLGKETNPTENTMHPNTFLERSLIHETVKDVTIATVQKHYISKS